MVITFPHFYSAAGRKDIVITTYPMRDLGISLASEPGVYQRHFFTLFAPELHREKVFDWL
jgi:hypothetical protein